MFKYMFQTAFIALLTLSSMESSFAARTKSTAEAGAAEAEAALPARLPIALVAPSGAVNEDVVTRFREALEEEGFPSVLPEGFQDAAASDWGCYANTVEQRVALILQAMGGESDTLWALRGGFGALDVVFALEDLLEQGELPEGTAGKTLIGFSDTTVLGLWLHLKLDWRFIHGPMYYCSETQDVSGKPLGSETSLTEVTSLLNGEVSSLSYPLTPLNEEAKRVSTEGSSVMGGCLSFIQRSIAGVLDDFNWDGKILFLEDTPEFPHRGWDVLAGMLRSKKFANIAGIIFGNFPLKGDGDVRGPYMKRLDEFFQKKHKTAIPLYSNPDFGHGLKNHPLPMGTPASISFDLEDAPVLHVSTERIQEGR